MTYWREPIARPMPPRSGPRGGCLMVAVGITALVIVAIIAATIAMAADRPVPRKHGAIDSELGKFGVYSDAYMKRRWARMCKGPARYDAMREANQEGKPNPC